MSEVVVELRGATAGPGAAPVLEGIDLEVRRGERLAIVGASGAGKTTLLRMLNASLAPRAGTVRVLGCDLSGVRPRARRAVLARIGTVHQDLALAERLRVVHNVNAGRLGSWPLWRAAASLMGPGPSADARRVLAHLGMEDLLWERTDRLSGGERQRVAIARVLVQQPELLLADEPTAQLDPGLRARVLTVLLDPEPPERTVIAALHDVPAALERFDRVIGLTGGRVALDRPAGAVSPDDLAELYGRQGTRS